MISRFFFCINSGRAGSHYLQHILDLSHNIASFGEKPPAMCGKYLQLINKYPYKHSFAERYIKVNKIKDIIKTIPNNKQIYSETNHMFIKTFFDVVIDAFGESIEVIILRRKLSHVLKSFIELEYFGKNEISYQWMTHPKSPTAAIKCLDKLDHYDKCIAYLLDIEARALRFQTDYPNIKIHNITLEQLNKPQYIKQLFEKLQLSTHNINKQHIGNIINKKEKRKAFFKKNTTIQYCKKRIKQYISNAKANKIDIPHIII